MAGYSSYGRRRYYRRGYRRGYRRYGGTSLRRYRSVALNDNETKVMTFTSVLTLQATINDSSSETSIGVANLLNGGNVSSSTITPSSGRIFFAGMLFDRLRIRSVQCTLRPRMMPSGATASNYIVYAAWDRYGGAADPAVETSYSIQSDPSSKQVVWTPGGSGTPLRTWIYSTSRDRYQYLPIVHNNALVSWNFGASSLSSVPVAPFFPTLLLSFSAAVGSTSVVVSYTIFTRVTVEFSGSYSNNTLNSTSINSLVAANNVMTPEEIPNSQPDGSSQYLAHQLQRMQTALPAVSRR